MSTIDHINRVAGFDLIEDDIAIDGHWTDPDEFAIADGFDNFDGIKAFFLDQFTGICIFWDYPALSPL